MSSQGAALILHEKGQMIDLGNQAVVQKKLACGQCSGTAPKVNKPRCHFYPYTPGVFTPGGQNTHHPLESRVTKYNPSWIFIFHNVSNHIILKVRER